MKLVLEGCWCSDHVFRATCTTVLAMAPQGLSLSLVWERISIALEHILTVKQIDTVFSLKTWLFCGTAKPQKIDYYT